MLPLRRVLLSLLLPVPTLAQSPEASRDGIPFVSAHGLIFVEIDREAEEPMLALLDTGANASAIAPHRAEKAALVKRGEVLGTTGTLKVDTVAVPGLKLGDSELPPLHATRRDLSGLLSPDARKVEMILGSDAFAAKALRLDFRTRVLALTPSDPASREGVPMELDQGIPTLPARLGTVATRLRIDTGASLFDSDDVYVNIPRDLWALLRKEDPDLKASRHFRGIGVGGAPVSLPVARLGPTSIAKHPVPSTHVIVQPEVGYFATPDAKGFVSNNFLGKLGCVVLDYGTQRFRVVPAAKRRRDQPSTPSSRRNSCRIPNTP